MIRSDETLGNIVSTHPTATDVFLRHRLDFCCGGKQSLADACADLGLDVAVVMEELNTAVARSSEDAALWRDAETPALIDHIVERYHAKHREDLPSLTAAAEKVERVHASKGSCPKGLAEHLKAMSQELELHMAKEERVLFPLLRAGQTGQPLGMPIQVMMQEHDAHGEELERLRELTGDLVAPPEACATWRALYEGLERLERELMTHIHLENSILFPRALGAAAQ